MQKKAAEFHRLNTKANECKRKADKARKDLYKEMKEHGLQTFDLITSIEGRDVSLEVKIGSSVSTVIDVAALRKIVSEEKFLQIISATKTNVEKYGGKDVSSRVSKTVTGTENVSVKAKK